MARRAEVAEANGALVSLDGPTKQTGNHRFMHNPQTLDQSASWITKSSPERDADQVVYRFTNAQRVRNENARNPSYSPHLLMVNQIWLWKLNGKPCKKSHMESDIYLDLVVTSFPKPWSTQSPDSLFHRVRVACSQGRIKQSSEIVQMIVAMAVNLPEELGTWGLNQMESWSTIFEKSIANAVRPIQCAGTYTHTDPKLEIRRRRAVPKVWLVSD
jgi:hypothetical protein